MLKQIPILEPERPEFKIQICKFVNVLKYL